MEWFNQNLLTWDLYRLWAECDFFGTRANCTLVICITGLQGVDGCSGEPFVPARMLGGLCMVDQGFNVYESKLLTCLMLLTLFRGIN